MKPFLRSLMLSTVFGLFLMAVTAGAASSGWSSHSPATAPEDPDVAWAQKAIAEKDWDKAVEMLKKVLARDGKNADIYNMLGYSERNRGNLDAAFQYYEKALELNPKHRGAHEYIGEAYLMADNLPKAEEHLAALDKLCFFPCEEYTDLKAAIAKYKQKHKK